MPDSTEWEDFLKAENIDLSATEKSLTNKVDLETKIIQLKTNSEKQAWKVIFHDDNENSVGNVRVSLTKLEFEIEDCFYGGVISPDLISTGDDESNIWTISRTTKPTRISMNVNGLDVFDILPSADTCNIPHWATSWDSNKIATEFYIRVYEYGGGVEGYRVIDMPGNYKRAESLYTGTRAFFLAY